MAARPAVDEEAVRRFALTVWSYRMGETVSLLVHLGDRLGIYREMAGTGPLTSDEVADRTRLHERFVREWLLAQAAAGLIDRHDDGRFELTPVQAAVLADEHGSVAFAAGAFGGGTDRAVVDAIAESFRTGHGITYDDLGPEAAATVARLNEPWYRLALVREVLPRLDGVVERLEAGADVVEVGSGAGVALTALAAAFPASRFVGFDPSEHATELARGRVEEAGLTNVEVVPSGVEQLPAEPSFDLALALDCLHDLPRADEAARAIRSVLHDDGAWLVREVRSSGDFDRDRRNPLLAMLYGFSVTACLQSGMSEPDGLGLGTLGLHPGRLETLVRDAGFASVTTHDIGDPANLYHEVRP